LIRDSERDDGPRAESALQFHRRDAPVTFRASRFFNAAPNILRSLLRRPPTPTALLDSKALSPRRGVGFAQILDTGNSHYVTVSGRGVAALGLAGLSASGKTSLAHGYNGAAKVRTDVRSVK